MNKIGINDFRTYNFLSELSVSPSGEKTAFVAGKAKENGRGYDFNIHVIEKGADRQLTSMGDSRTYMWDGDNAVIFPGNRDKNESGTDFYKIELSGGEAKKVFSVPFKVMQVKRVNEDKIAFVSRFDHNKELLDKMTAEGVEFRTGADVGKELTPEQLRRDFDAVVLCCGAAQPRDLAVPGRKSGGVWFAVDFLTQTTRALLDGAPFSPTAKGKQVVVVGGGDTGNDCVGTCIRQGCAGVVQLEMMPKLPDARSENNPWPEWPRVCKTDYGQEEAAAVFGQDPRLYQTTVTALKADQKGQLKAVETVELDRELKPVPGTERTLPCQLLLIAAGFLGAQHYVPEAFGLELTPRSCVKTPEGRYQTGAPGVFAAGDMRRGQSLVVWAIAEGRQAAKEVDDWLSTL